MVRKQVDPARSEAAKRGAATKKARLIKEDEDNKEQQRWELWERRIRDVFIFAFGIWVAVNELAFRDNPRESGLMFAAAILGVPFVLAAATLRR